MYDNFNTMVSDLKKEISDNLTRRISFTPIEPAKNNHFSFKKKRDKMRFVLSCIGVILAIILVLVAYLIKINNSNQVTIYNIKNDIKYDAKLTNEDFQRDNESSNVFLPNLIDKINLRFINNVLYPGKYNYDKTVVAKIVISDSNDNNNIVFQKRDILVDMQNGEFKSNTDNVTPVSIDYQKYNNIVNKYKKNIKLSVVTSLYVTYTNSISSSNGIVKLITQEVEIPLGSDTVSLTTNYNKLESGKIIKSKEKPFIIILLYIASLIILIPCICIIIFTLKKNKNNLTELEKKYNKIMKNYNNIIIEVENDDFDRKLVSINVKYFVDLIDAQQELHIPILCYTDKLTGRTWFYIVTDKYMYKYELSKSDELI